MLNEIKKRCYITTAIYDDEIQSLINSCILDCLNIGINEKFFKPNDKDKYDDLVLNCITNYVKAYRGNDRTDTEEYLKMYYSIRDKLSLIKDYKEVFYDE